MNEGASTPSINRKGVVCDHEVIIESSPNDYVWHKNLPNKSIATITDDTTGQFKISKLDRSPVDDIRIIPSFRDRYRSFSRQSSDAHTIDIQSPVSSDGKSLAKSSSLSSIATTSSNLRSVL